MCKSRISVSCTPDAVQRIALSLSGLEADFTALSDPEGPASRGLSFFRT
jgi:hypothetical protein